jgi:ABC-2 type transport system permease protein
MLSVLRQMVRRRRAAVLWWSLGLIGAVALLAAAYPTVRDNTELDRTFAGLPPGVQGLLGLGGANAITSPIGYLNSQFFSNLLPVMLLVFAVGLAAWTIGGDESAGTLELLIANPVSRSRVALERAGGLVFLLAVLAAVCAGAMVAVAQASGLSRGLSAERMVAATVACALLALTFAALAFAVGSSTGNPRMAVAVASVAAAAGYLVEGLGQQVTALRAVQAASPWHWLLSSDPLRNGLVWRSWALPLAVATALIAVGVIRFARRDLR